MNRRLDRLNRALDFPPEPPPFHIDADAVCRRVRHTLARHEQERNAYMRHKLKIGLVLAAAILVLTGTALAVAANLDVLRAFFDGDPSVADGLVDREVRSVADQNYRFTVENSVSDGENIFLLVRIDALSEEGRAKLNSDDWDGMDLFDIYPLVKDFDTGNLVHPSASGTGYGEVEEARTKTSRSYAVNPSVSSTDGRTAEAVHARMGYMEKGLSIQVPLTPVDLATIEVGAQGQSAPTLDRAEGVLIRVDRVSMSPFTLKVELTWQSGAAQNADCPSPPLLFRKTDGTLMGFAQMTTASRQSWGDERTADGTHSTLIRRFREVVDLTELSGVVLWGVEYPLDGSEPREVEVDPRLLPFTLPLMPALGENITFSLPVRALMEGLGGSCTWDPATRSATLAYRGRTVVLTPGSTAALVDGAPAALDAAPQILDGTLCVSAALCNTFYLDILVPFNSDQTDRVCWIVTP